MLGIRYRCDCSCRLLTGLFFGGLLFQLLLWAVVYRLATTPPHFEQLVRYPPPFSSSSDAFMSPPQSESEEGGEERYALLAVFNIPPTGNFDPPSFDTEEPHFLVQVESLALNVFLFLACQKQRQHTRGWQEIVQGAEGERQGEHDRAGEGLFSSFSLRKHLFDRHKKNAGTKNVTGGGPDNGDGDDDLEEFELQGYSFLATSISLDIETVPNGGPRLAARGFLLPPNDGDNEGSSICDGPPGPFASDEDGASASEDGASASTEFSFRHCSSLDGAQRLAAALQRDWLPLVWAEFLDDGDRDSDSESGLDLDLEAALPWRKGSVLRAVRWDPDWGGIRAWDEKEEEAPRRRKQAETAAVVQRYRWNVFPSFPFSHFQDLFQYFPLPETVIGLLSRMSPQPSVAREQLRQWDHFRCVVSSWQDNSGGRGWVAAPSGITELTYALSSSRDGRIQRLRQELLLSKDAEATTQHKEPHAHAADVAVDGAAVDTGSDDSDAFGDGAPATLLRQYIVEPPTNFTSTRQQSTETQRQGAQTDEL